MLTPATAPQIPIACARSRGSSNVLRMIAIATGLSIAPATPCTMRKAISQPMPGARLQASDASGEQREAELEHTRAAQAIGDRARPA